MKQEKKKKSQDSETSGLYFAKNKFVQGLAPT